jgi:hypothetical protein
MKTSIALKTLLGAASMALPLMALAESNVQTGAATNAPGATAHVDFSIVIPKILFLRVGTGSTYPGSLTGTAPALSNNNAMDQIVFSPTAAQLGTGPLTGTGGDLTNGVVTAAIVSNSGNVTIGATSLGALNDGVVLGDTISYTQITTTAASNTTATVLPAPVLADGVGATTLINAPASKIIIQDAKWTYKYANAAIVPSGTYGGVNTQNSRVTYTATMP